METRQAKPRFSLPSVLAIGAAVGSFLAGAFGGFLLALVAIFFGVIGIGLSLAPSVRGGFLSILCLIVAAVGIILAVIKVLVWAI